MAYACDPPLFWPKKSVSQHANKVSFTKVEMMLKRDVTIRKLFGVHESH